MTWESAGPSANANGWEDRFGRKVTYLRLSVTDRCNFRCLYCMPEEGVPLRPNDELLSFEEIAQVVGVLAREGVRRVRVTGGEPLVRKELPTLIRKLARLPGIEEIVLTTNGFLLDRHAAALREAGLSEVTVSLDTLDPARFSHVTRRGELGRVLEGIKAAQAAGFGPIKLNAVLIRGFNDDEVLSLTEWAIERGHVLRFIEFMPIGEDTLWAQVRGGGCVPQAEVLAVLGARWRLTPQGMRPGAGPSRYWGLEGPGAPHGARVGVISAVTECFCDACNRLRLTPQGGLRACLADDREVALRALLRQGCDEETLAQAVRRALWGKEAAHSFTLEGGAVTRKQMVSIGG